MRVRNKADAWIALVLTTGAITLVAAVVEGAHARLTMLALLGAAAVLTELMQVPSDESSLDPLDAHAFSFSSGVQIATVLLLGPWAGALVAAGGVLAADGVRGWPFRRIAYNASVFAIASVVGGLVYELLGGVPGVVGLPGDLGAIAVLATTMFAVNSLLVTAVVAFLAGLPFLALEREKLRSELSAVIGEAGLGLALAVLAVKEPWAILALVPLVFAVFQAHERLATLRRETARALEAFANVVDERDPSTYRHSERVAEHVARLGQALGLSGSQVGRLRWAGRLHDLGKIAVDSAVLQRPNELSSTEWLAVRRHPRLSARLLRRFRFAAAEARAIEYHHERFDGKGYYGIETSALPLAAHFLIVADSYDAMVSDRPYRRGLSQEAALAELERNAGTQFHPAVAKAFSALQRGIDPRTVLTVAERSELRRMSPLHATALLDKLLARARDPQLVAIAAVVAGLFAVAATVWPAAVAAAALAVGALAVNAADRRRGRRLAGELTAFARSAAGPETVFATIAGRLAEAFEVRWAGLVSWEESELEGALELEWSSGAWAAPGETALTSWLVREADTAGELLLAPRGGVGRESAHCALPLRTADSLGAYFVVAFGQDLPRHVKLALAAAADEIAAALASHRGTDTAVSPLLAVVS